ncbi:MAG TPA: SMP-30/gluconolactonase/LRE family protein [Planctomycetes bacterium]|nr:SMP-30/gluconolactonase/LRE family protein [Fuerstiella sp.]HIK94198.1 SMP-30/gluconolactonase/LRE family protein [Planctomycetota bacterium]
MYRFTYGLFVIVACVLPQCTQGSESLIPAGRQLEELWNDGEFTEGVAVRADGMVFFSDITRDPNVKGRILKFDPTTGKTTVFSADSRKSNGLFFDADGRMLASCGANGGAMALCEVSRDGIVKPLVDRFHGKRFNSPNDLVVHPDGSVYFSDPRYLGPEPIELDHQSVYRFVPKTGQLRRVTKDIEKPNGVHVSPDGRTLYVAETNNGSTGQDPDATPQRGRMTLNAFNIRPDGSLANKRVLVDFGDQLGTDGMTIDKAGNIYAAVRSANRFGIVIYSSAGKELAYIRTPSLPTNGCFGVGSTSSILYVTAGGGFYRIDLAQ